ncbi:MAG: biopolymer transporter ExbD [Brevundimonas sp.]|nr:biopolymer transporter ExbD [Brevundimonas sp.]
MVQSSRGVDDDGGADARDRPLFLRADAQVPYQAVARVMARLSTNGFVKLNLITDTAGNTAAAEPVEGDL